MNVTGNVVLNSYNYPDTPAVQLVGDSNSTVVNNQVAGIINIVASFNSTVISNKEGGPFCIFFKRHTLDAPESLIQQCALTRCASAPRVGSRREALFLRQALSAQLARSARLACHTSAPARPGWSGVGGPPGSRAPATPRRTLPPWGPAFGPAGSRSAPFCWGPPGGAWRVLFSVQLCARPF